MDLPTFEGANAAFDQYNQFMEQQKEFYKNLKIEGVKTLVEGLPLYADLGKKLSKGIKKLTGDDEEEAKSGEKGAPKPAEKGAPKPAEEEAPKPVAEPVSEPGSVGSVEGTVQEGVSSVESTIQQGVSSVEEGISSTISAAQQGISSAEEGISGFFRGASDFMDRIVARGKEFFDSIGKNAESVTENMGETMGYKFQPHFDIDNEFTDAPERFGKMTGRGEEMFNSFSNKAGQAAQEGLESTTEQVTSKVGAELAETGAKVGAAAARTGAAVGEAAAGAATAAEEATTSVLSTLATAGATALEAAGPIGEIIGTGFLIGEALKDVFTHAPRVVEMARPVFTPGI